MQIHSLPGFFEPFSAFTHLGGALVFGALAWPLLRRGRGNGWRVLLLGVFAFSAVLLLSMSGVYHMLPEGGTARAVLGRLDKAAIFVLIAGTHTPVQGFFFRGFGRWSVIALMWALVATGVTLFSIFYDDLPRGLGTGIYLALGWIAGVAGLVVWRRLGTARIMPLVLGGVVYSVGAILSGSDWPTLVPGVVTAHEVWHLAVLLALGLHWRFVLKNAHCALDGPIGR